MLLHSLLCRKDLSDGQLTTEAMRQEREKRKLEHYSMTVIRVHLPNQWVLQGCFKPGESCKHTVCVYVTTLNWYTCQLMYIPCFLLLIPFHLQFSLHHTVYLIAFVPLDELLITIFSALSACMMRRVAIK